MSIFVTHFHKTPNIKFQGSPSNRNALIHAHRRKDGPTDGHDKDTGAFRDYVKA